MGGLVLVCGGGEGAFWNQSPTGAKRQLSLGESKVIRGFSTGRGVSASKPCIVHGAAAVLGTKFPPDHSRGNRHPERTWLLPKVAGTHQPLLSDSLTTCRPPQLIQVMPMKFRDTQGTLGPVPGRRSVASSPGPFRLIFLSYTNFCSNKTFQNTCYNYGILSFTNECVTQ